jgi:uncharacterized membrane protein
MKVLNVAVGAWKLIARYPALTAGVFQVIIIVGAKIGLHLTADQLATVAGVVAAVFGLLVHAGVIPVSKVANVKAGLKPTVPGSVEVGEPVAGPILATNSGHIPVGDEPPVQVVKEAIVPLEGK